MTDQEIRDALRVDPSPEFPARVRTRIASEPAPSAWRWSWTIAAAGALAAMALVAVVMSRPRHENPSAPGVAHAVTPAAAPDRPTPQQTEPARSVAARRPDPSASARPGAPRASKGRTVTREAEVLLDPAETRALRSLIAGVREGRVDLAAAQRSVALAPMELAPITAIDIAPLGIEPIAPPSGAEGVRP
jgi:hypothetical protein